MDVKTVCLGLLMDQDATGYEIQKTLKEGWLSFFFEASYGSIYPALNRLTEDGHVSCTEQPQDGRPDKKIYRITPKGRDVFVNALLEPVAEDKFRSDFLARILFSGNLPPILVKRFLDDRIQLLESELSDLNAMKQDNLTAAKSFLAGMGRTVNEATLNYIKQHRSSVEQHSNGGANNDQMVQNGAEK